MEYKSDMYIVTDATVVCSFQPFNSLDFVVRLTVWPTLWQRLWFWVFFNWKFKSDD